MVDAYKNIINNQNNIINYLKEKIEGAIN